MFPDGDDDNLAQSDSLSFGLRTVAEGADGVAPGSTDTSVGAPARTSGHEVELLPAAPAGTDRYSNDRHSHRRDRHRNNRQRHDRLSAGRHGNDRHDRVHLGRRARRADERGQRDR